MARWKRDCRSVEWDALCDKPTCKSPGKACISIHCLDQYYQMQVLSSSRAFLCVNCHNGVMILFLILLCLVVNFWEESSDPMVCYAHFRTMMLRLVHISLMLESGCRSCFNTERWGISQTHTYTHTDTHTHTHTHTSSFLKNLSKSLCQICLCLKEHEIRCNSVTKIRR